MNFFEIIDKNKKYIALGGLILVLFLLVQMINPIFFHNSINHTYPQGYLAGDAYITLANIKYVSQVGLYRDTQPDLVEFSTKKYTTIEPPLFIYLGAAITKIMGVESYDGTNIALTLLLISSILIIFIFLYKIEPLISIIFLPYALFVVAFPYMASYTWGYWRQFMAMNAFFFSLIIFQNKLSLKTSLLLSVVLSCTILGYPYYALFFVFLYILVLLFSYFSQKQKIKELFIYSLIIFTLALIFTSVYLLDFVASRQTSEGSILKASTDLAFGSYTAFGATVQFSQVQGLTFVFISLIIILLYFIIKIKSHNNLVKISLALLLMLFTLSALPSLGITQRAYQLRFLWPLIITMLFSFALYILLSVFIKSKPVKSLIMLGVFILMLFLFYPISEQYSKVQLGSIVSEQHWAAYQYITNTADNDSEVLIIDPTQNQDHVIVSMAKKRRFLNQIDIMNILEKNLSLDNVSTERQCHYPAANFKDFKFEKITPPETCYNMNYPMCHFDYILLVLINNQQYLSWVDQQKLTSIFTPIKQFDYVVILKNNNPRCV